MKVATVHAGISCEGGVAATLGFVGDCGALALSNPLSLDPTTNIDKGKIVTV
mgnify:CR=1 FL=1